MLFLPQDPVLCATFRSVSSDTNARNMLGGRSDSFHSSLFQSTLQTYQSKSCEW
jgi:hypothetical protein